MVKLVFMGTPDFAVPVLKQLIRDEYEIVGVVTQPDRPVGRKQIITPPPVKVTALEYGIPVFQPQKLRDEKALQEILDLDPDLVITCAYGQILPKKLLDYPKYGCINVHASLLPELRGGAPIHHAIMQGKKETGITIMYMVEKLDAGDILSQVRVPIDERDTAGTLHDKLSEAGAKLLSETLPKLLRGEITPRKQNDEEATYAYNIKREHEKIDWTKTGEAIYNQIRGLHPWPVSYTTLNGKTLKIWWGEKVPLKTDAKPGTVVRLENDGIIVATGNEVAIKITDLQLAGKKRMNAEQFLAGYRQQIKEGTVLGVNHD